MNSLMSFFDSHNQNYIWEQFEQYRYKQDNIRFEFSGYLIEDERQKIVSLHIGDERIYYLSHQQVRGVLPLTFVRMMTYIKDSELVFRLSRNCQYTDIVVEEPEKFQEILRNKCILTTFHDEYQVIKGLGKGGFAHVYLAKKDDQLYAVKAFNKLYVKGCSNGKESLENEIKIMRKLKSDYFVELYEVHETEHSIYLVMNYIEGGHLKTRGVVQQGSTLQTLMFNLLKAINDMHQKKCMHRDLKPQNILLLSDVDVVIADFGFACFLNSKPLFKRCGTPGYIAPEILRLKSGDQLYNEKCDIFSLGVIFYQLITGKHLFGEGDAKLIVEKNKQCDITFVQLIPYEQLKNLLQKMLEQNPNKRFSAEECLAHPYFKELFQSEIQITVSEPIYNEIPQLDSLKGSQQLVTKIQFNGNIDSFRSLSDQSPKHNPSPKQKNPSIFTNFQQAMEAVSKNRQQKPKDNLRKVAMKNAFYQKMQTKEDFIVKLFEEAVNFEKLKKQNSHEI